MSAAGEPPGPAIEPKSGPGDAVVPGRGDDEHVERERAGDRLRLRAVGERGERLGHAEQRDPGRVVGVAVAVRVDGALEPGDQLVAARVDGVLRRWPSGCQPATRIGSTVAPGRDAVEPVGPARADEQARELRAVPLELRAGSAGRRWAAAFAVPPTMSIPGSTRPPR